MLTMWMDLNEETVVSDKKSFTRWINADFVTHKIIIHQANNVKPPQNELFENDLSTTMLGPFVSIITELTLFLFFFYYFVVMLFVAALISMGVRVTLFIYKCIYFQWKWNETSCTSWPSNEFPNVSDILGRNEFSYGEGALFNWPWLCRHLTFIHHLIKQDWI